MAMQQLCCRVIDESNAAMGAVHDGAAAGTVNVVGVAPAVEQEDGLLFLIELALRYMSDIRYLRSSPISPKFPASQNINWSDILTTS
jgi:hypothetical protein